MTNSFYPDVYQPVHPSLRDVTIVEVGPRDGLQNEPEQLSVQERRTLIQMLAASGISQIEGGSFVSPTWVPQMAASDEVLSGLALPNHVTLSALVPNMKGWERAQALPLQQIAIFVAASESFSHRNTNGSIDEILVRSAPVIASAKHANRTVRGYLSCATHCPFEGKIAPKLVADLAERLLTLGCDTIVLSDTIGAATPLQIKSLLDAVTIVLPTSNLALHLHDSHGQAIANVYAGLECGITMFDSSIAGLGGCPYAPGASGNVATEDLVYLLDGLGLNSGINLDRLLEVTVYVSQLIKRSPRSKAAQAIFASRNNPG